MPGRRDEVLDAAVTVLADGGLRRLTYQAVDAAAGVPTGTTSNHFRNRDLLVAGVVTHLEALDAREWQHFAAAPAPLGPDALANALAETVRHHLGPAKHRTAARYALALEGISRPAVQESLSRAHTSLMQLTSRWLSELGSTAPLDHCRILFDYLDGMIFHQTTHPRNDFDPTPGIRTVLTALLPSATPQT